MNWLVVKGVLLFGCGGLLVVKERKGGVWFGGEREIGEKKKNSRFCLGVFCFSFYIEKDVIVKMYRRQYFGIVLCASFFLLKW